MVGTEVEGRRLVALGRTTVCLCVLGALVVAPPVYAQDESSRSPWEGSLAVQLGYPFSYVQVGENQYPGRVYIIPYT